MQFVREVNSEKNTIYYIATPDHEQAMSELQIVARDAKIKPELYKSMFADRGHTNKMVEVVILKIMTDKADVFADKIKEFAGGDHTTSEYVEKVRPESKREEDTGSEWLNNALGRNKPKPEPVADKNWLDKVLGSSKDE